MRRTNDPHATRLNVKAHGHAAEKSRQERARPVSPARRPKRRPNFKPKPPRPLLPLLVKPLLFLCAVALVALAGWSLRLPQFDVKRVSVNGARAVSPTEIAGLAPLPAHENLLLYWLRRHKSIAQAVEAAEPAVETARVGVRPPSTLTVTVAERQPYAALRRGSQYWIVDRSGVPFRTAPAPVADLPCIALSPDLPPPVLGKPLSLSPSAPVGAGFALLAALTSNKIATLMKIRAITVDQNANICLNMVNNLQIRLGQADQLPQKLALVTTTLASDTSLAQRAAYLDFSYPERPAWKPRSGSIAASPLPQDLAD